MTVRPRYTYQAKAHDLRMLATITARAVGIIATAAAPPAQAVITSVAATAMQIITRQYTDPEDKS